jgi:hypothetical protein
MTLDPHQLEGGKRHRRWIPHNPQKAIRVVSLLKLLYDFPGPLVVPERDPIQNQSPIVVDQNRAMHLTAGGHADNAVRPLLNLAQDGADRDYRAFPPRFRALFGPSKVRDNLIVFARRKGRCFPVKGYQSSPYTSGAHVDGKQEILHSEVQELQEFRSSRSVREFSEEGS